MGYGYRCTFIQYEFCDGDIDPVIKHVAHQNSCFQVGIRKGPGAHGNG